MGMQCRVCGKVFSRSQTLPFHRHLATHDADVDTECTCSKCVEETPTGQHFNVDTMCDRKKVKIKFQFLDPLTIAQPLPTTSKKRGRQEAGSEGGQEAKKVKKRVERFKHKQSKEDIFKKMQQSFAGNKQFDTNT